jgi:hypothetical protein
MRLTFIFPSDTNESWFNDFIEHEFSHKTEKIGNGIVIDGHVNPDDKNRMIEEARNLGADMYEHNDDNERRRIF